MNATRTLETLSSPSRTCLLDGNPTAKVCAQHINTQILHHKQHLSVTSDEVNGMMSLRTNVAFNWWGGGYSLRIENNQDDM